MKKLTENLIQQRLKTCTTDLDKVLQINITGRELQDVSLLRKMTGVEILSLSVNQISSLSDFQFCRNLKELYLRNNNISDIRQIYYLTNLPKLKLLMLSQNPCANNALYRPTIIKNLPSLTELDGMPITLEERQMAAKTGLTLNPEEFRALESGFEEPLVRRQNVQTSFESLKVVDEVEPIMNEAASSNDTYFSDSPKDSKGLVTPPNQEPEPVVKPNTCDYCREKETKQLYSRELSNQKFTDAVEKSLKTQMPCKFCKGQAAVESFLGMRVPKNTNILSATLNLIKELDYSSLQVVQAELISVLNSLEVEFVCQAKKGSNC